MKSLLTGALLAAALPSGAQINAEDWDVRVYFTGSQTTVINGQGTTRTWDDQLTHGAGEGAEFKGVDGNPSQASSSLSGKWRIHVKWVGRGVPPRRFLVVHSSAMGAWSGSSGQDDSSNGLDDRCIHHPYNLGDFGTSDGWSSFELKMNGQQEIDRQIPCSATAQSIAQLGTVGTTGSLIAYVSPRQVIPWTNPGPTIFRKPGGFPGTGGFQEDTGRCRIDRSYRIFDQFGVVTGKYQEDLYGQADGDWYPPFTALDWGPDMYWVNKNFGTGWTEAWTFPEYVDESHLIQGYNGPDHRQATVSVSDQNNQEQSTFSIYTHSPVEGTGEKWKTDISGPVRLSTIPEPRACGFTDVIIAAITNASDLTIDASVQISSSASYTYGAQTEYGGSLGIEWKIIKLNFSTTRTVSSSETYQVGHQYSLGVKLPPHSQLRLVSAPMGGVKYPICSHWNQGGWSGDTRNLDVILGFLNYIIYIRGVNPWD